MLLHQIFEQKAVQAPTKTAIDNGTKTISYGELNTSSDILAAYIESRWGNRSGVIALCLEKEPLLISVVLAVLKAGYAWVPLQIDAPRSRLQKILEVAKPVCILAVASTFTKVDGLGDVIRLDDPVVAEAPALAHELSGNTQPSDLCHILFTSGTTGTPKGVMIAHQAVVNNVQALVKMFEMDHNTRTLQFAPYTFDIFGLDLFMTFAVGGCLILGEMQDMMSDLTGFSNRRRVSYAQLTPTIVSQLHPERTTTLQTLVSSGEPLTAEIIRAWAPRVALFNAYGPTETIVCTVKRIIPCSSPEPRAIGGAVPGAEVILVQPDGTSNVEVGAVGEICVAGIQVFRGYLGDHDSSPFFLRSGQVFYRTGDLGVLNILPDGSTTVCLLGRRDRQDKIHGVRINLEEVDSALRINGAIENCVTLIPKAGPAAKRLTAVLSVKGRDGWEQQPTQLEEFKLLQPRVSTHHGLLEAARSSIAQELPPQALPSSWFVIDRFPLTISGKIDHARVRTWLEAMGTETYSHYIRSWSVGVDNHDGPGELEHHLKRVLSKATGLPASDVDLHVPLMQTGLDSIGIYKLVSIARSEGLHLTVQQILTAGSISKLLESLNEVGPSQSTRKPGRAFDLIQCSRGVQSLIDSAAKQCGTSVDDIQDLYPCTPTQAGIMALAARHEESYICKMTFELSEKTDTMRLLQAWDLLRHNRPILRTRLIYGPDAIDYYSAVISTSVACHSKDIGAPMTFGDDLCRVRVSHTPNQRLFELEIHHCLFDGWTKELLILDLKRLYERKQCHLVNIPTHRDFVAYCATSQEDHHVSFWASYLSDCQHTALVSSLPDRFNRPVPQHRVVTHSAPDLSISLVVRKHNVKATTIIHLAWALTLAKFTNTYDVLFGATLSGRDTAMEGIENVMGPTITTVPVRLRLQQTLSVSELLQQHHRASVDAIAHQHYGLQNIARIRPDGERACYFDSLLIIQPHNTLNDEVHGLMTERETSGAETLRTYPLSLEIVLGRSEGITIRAHHDEMLIDATSLEHVLKVFKASLSYIYSSEVKSSIGDWMLLDVAGSADPRFIPHSKTAGKGLPEDVQRSKQTIHHKSEAILHLETAWSDILGVRPVFRSSDHFFKAGGDSLSCIRLALACRRKGWLISVAQIYENPTLEAMAAVMTSCHEEVLSGSPAVSSPQVEKPAAFSLLGDSDIKEILREVAIVCRIQPDDIEDLLPSTPFQQGLAAIDLQLRGAYMAKWVFELPLSTDLVRFKQAVERVIEANPILRTTFAHTPLGTLQAVLAPETWRKRPQIDASSGPYRELEGNLQLLHYAVYSDLRQDTITFELAIHHILYDQWVMQCMLDDIAFNYEHPGRERPGRVQYAKFVEHLVRSAKDSTDSVDFWRQELADVEVMDMQLPNQPAESHKTDAAVECRESSANIRALCKSLAVTPAAIGATCLALLLSRHCKSSDVTFGLTFSGRNIAGLEDVFGPTISTVPLRTKMLQNQSDASLIQSIQSKIRALEEHQHIGLQQITKAGGSGPINACAFRVLLVLQEERILSPGGPDSLQMTIREDKTFMALNYDLVFILITSKRTEHMVFRLEYCSDVVSKEKARDLLDLMVEIERRLTLTERSPSFENSVSQDPKQGKMTKTPEAVPVPPSDYADIRDTVKELWAKELGVPAQDIKETDTMTRLGGDSVALIRFVSAARKAGIAVKMGSHITPRMTLSEMSAAIAQALPDAAPREGFAPAPFSLMQGMQMQDCIKDAAKKCNVPRNAIVDVFPCTPLQEGFMASTSLEPGAYFLQNCYLISTEVHVERLRSAIEEVSRSEPLLRTRIFINARHEVVQAVVNESGPSFSVDDRHRTLDHFLQHDRERVFDYGSPLTRFSLVIDARLQHYLVISQHHSVSDGWSLQLTLQAVRSAYAGAVIKKSSSLQQSMPEFVRFVKSVQESREAAKFWRDYLAGAEETKFPVKAHKGIFNAQRWSKYTFSCPETSIASLPVILEAAWGLVISRHSNHQDVTFGVVRSGRMAPLAGIEGMIGPTIATVPRRLKLDHNMRVSEFLAALQAKSDAATPFEQYGLSRIASLGGSARRACNFQTMLVVQPKFQAAESSTADEIMLGPVNIETMSGTHAMIIDCEPCANGELVIQVNFDYASVPADLVQKVIDDFVSAILQLSSMPSLTLGDVTWRDAESAGLPLPSDTMNGVRRDSPHEHWPSPALLAAQKISSAGSSQRSVPEGNSTILKNLWADVLEMDATDISTDDDFLILGGDSISAIKLASRALAQGLTLPARSILQQPGFMAMLDLVTEAESAAATSENDSTPKDIDTAVWLSQIRKSYELLDEIENVFPCTPFQTNVMALTMHDSGLYTATETFRLSKSTNVARFQEAWNTVYQRHELLRSRVFQILDGHDDMKLVQAIMKSRSCPWEVSYSELPFREQQDSNRTVIESTPFGKPLARFRLIETPESVTYFQLIRHHATYDAFSTKMIWEDLQCAYNGGAVPPRLSFKVYVDHVISADTKMALDFWQKALDGYTGEHYPGATQKRSSEISPVISTRLEASMPAAAAAGNFRFSTIARAAWMLTLMAIDRCSAEEYDISFGTVVSGRMDPVPGIADVAGPTISTVPFRLKFSADLKTGDYLEAVHSLDGAMSGFEYIGLREIGRLSPTAKAACQFNNLLVIQTPEGQWSDDIALCQEVGTDTMDASYPLLVECTPVSISGSTTIRLDLTAQEHSLLKEEAQAVLRVFVRMIQLLSLATHRHEAVSALAKYATTHDDYKMMASFNDHEDDPQDHCLHDLATRNLRLMPSSIAVHAHDRDLTYAELDLTSAALANHLRKFCSLCQGSLVPLYFEKSSFMVIAMIGVMRAGAGYVPLDPTHPIARVKDILAQCQAKLILVSPEQEKKGLAAACGVQTLVVDSSLVRHACRSAVSGAKHSCATPDDVAYVIFTSGSTGRPKGVVMQHKSVARSMLQYDRVFGLRKLSQFRTLQFSSYTFDVSVAEIFATLAFGGTVCVPREEDRLNDLPGVICRMAIGVAFVTPTVAKLIQPEDVPDLEMLITAGEMLPSSLSSVWLAKGNTKLFNAYGPTETSVHCTAALVHENTPFRTIGFPFGGKLWIVDANDHDALLPVGCVGELVVSGGTMALEYLNNPEATAQAYIEDVAWLKNRSSRRIYKTGDLARYRSDGSIEFYGRRNNRQVKLRGFRIELDEIEAALHGLVGNKWFRDAAVERLMAGSTDSLVVFFLATRETTTSDAAHLLLPISDISPNLKRVIRSAIISLQGLLPRYSIPSLFIPIRYWPLSTAGKIDRNLLRRNVESLSNDELYDYRDLDDESAVEDDVVIAGDEPDQASSDCEALAVVEAVDEPMKTGAEIVVSIWRKVFELGEDYIPKMDHDFFNQGGDSVSAISLVGHLHRQGIRMSVAEIYTARTLGNVIDLASASKAGVKSSTPNASSQPSRFSLLPVSGAELDAAMQELSSELKLSLDLIEDAYPCLPLQEGIMFLSERAPGAFHGRIRLLMPRRLDVQRLGAAMQALIELHAILRTRIIFHSTMGSVQVVLRASTDVGTNSHNEEEHDGETLCFGYGKPLWHHALVAHESRTFLELDCHHSIYDAWSLSLLSRDLANLYRSAGTELGREVSSFTEMVAHCTNAGNKSAALAFWEDYLRGGFISDFPSMSGHAHDKVRATEYRLRVLQLDLKGITKAVPTAAILVAAWSLVVSNHSASNDVCFGLLLSGRNACIKGVEDMMAPTINTVPFRAALGSQATMTIGTMLDQVQAHMTKMIPHQFMSLDQLRKMLTDGQADFGSLLSIQSETGHGEGSEFGIHPVPTEGEHEPAIFGEPYPLFLEAKIDKMAGTITLGAQYDPVILPTDQLHRILEQYETAIRMFADRSLGGTTLLQSPHLSDADRDLLQKLAGPTVEHVDQCVHDLVEEIARSHPQHEAVEGFNSSLTYGELSLKSDSFAMHLQAMHGKIELGDSIAVWMETSPTAITAIMTIMKLGGCYVPLDSRIPLSRAEYIIEDIRASIILVSQEKNDIAQQLAASLKRKGKAVQVVVVEQELAKMRTCSAGLTKRIAVKASDLAYIIYTSGSTGKPKGVMMEHWALTSTVKEQARTYGFDMSTRMFGLANLGWDPSLLEIFAILSHGGCLCIPNESERGGCQELVDSINAHQADQISTAPAVASLIDLRKTPSVKAISLGGEVLRNENIINASQANVRLFNIYGPSEACIDSIVHRGVVPGVSPHNIGKPMSSQVWIVHPDFPQKLMPPGCPGEIALSGPLARGYLNDEEKTARAFLHDCPFACPVYLTGDLARFSTDGSVHFLGRKDRQIKMNGQRVELGDIESAVKEIYSNHDVVVDYFAVPPGDNRKMLVVFLCQTNSASLPSTRSAAIAPSAIPVVIERQLSPKSSEFQTLQQRLKQALPRYMVPRVFVDVTHIPLSNADKVDRKLLQEAYHEWQADAKIGKVNSDSGTPSAYTDTVIAEPLQNGGGMLPHSSSPTTMVEKAVRTAWALAVGCDPNSISREDDIFDLGADSLATIKLTTYVRKAGYKLSIADVYSHPTLAQMVYLVRSSGDDNMAFNDSAINCPAPFSLLPAAIRDKMQHGSKDIVDAFPCTAFQTASIVQGQKRHKAFYSWFVVHIVGSLDEQRLRSTCEQLLRRHPVLRSSFEAVDGMLVQQVYDAAVVTANVQRLAPSTSADAFVKLLDQDVPSPVSMGNILTRYRLSATQIGGVPGNLLAIGLSHAQYDGFCWNVITHDLQRAYLIALDGTSVPPPFSRVIDRIVKNRKDPSVVRFWAELMKSSSMTTLVPQEDAPAAPRVLRDRQVAVLPIFPPMPRGFTFATVIKAAWALVLAQVLDIDDVVFGSLVFGRDPQIEGIGEVVGACLNIVPNRASFGANMHTLSDLLLAIRKQQVDIVPFEATSLAEISKYAGWKPWTRFGSVVQHQNFEETGLTGAASTRTTPSETAWSFEGSATYSLCDDVVDCWITSVPKLTETQVQFQYNSDWMPDDCAAKLLSALCTTIRAMYQEGPSISMERLKTVVLGPRFGSLRRLRAQLAAVARSLSLPSVRLSCEWSENQEDLSTVQVLHDLWAEVLPKTHTWDGDEEASWFDIGGDSVRALQLAAACHRAHVTLSLQDIFDFPSLKLQAAHLCGMLQLHNGVPQSPILLYEP